ncbi:Potassium transport protein [Fusarium keratoplasticum]|uniref:Potassium transport protein n=1 Tax=Fusarium keratoplasticum TaxID=1328300 RepID=A0ACC0QU62_9HYPO|nr:Potassium transport protein [Fusarium keratoplasticum]KAI8666020.1 Potassium transport protein [Fusarium keratoplasticum]
MWRPELNFVKLHYLYILLLGLLSFVVLYPEGNISAIDAYFMGASASTVTGLATVDLKELRVYQQLYLYFVPMFANLVFINIIVVVVRLFWFNRHLKKAAPFLLRQRRRNGNGGGGVVQKENDPELGSGLPRPETPSPQSSPEASGGPTPPSPARTVIEDTLPRIEERSRTEPPPSKAPRLAPPRAAVDDEKLPEDDDEEEGEDSKRANQLEPRITFDPSTDHHPRHEATLYIPGPRDRDRGKPLVELNGTNGDGRDDDEIETITRTYSTPGSNLRRRRSAGLRISEARSMERVATVASSMFVIGGGRDPRRERLATAPTMAAGDFPQLSREVTIGRNSMFHNLSSQDREELGGIEYRSLKLLLKIILTYFFGLHFIGMICLIGWIQYAPSKYTDHIEESGQNKIWWAIYSAQTMVDNLGFTLTPDSMMTFSDAPAPMLIMSVLALAGHTFYPVILRFILWSTSKLLPEDSSLHEPLSFLLNHPRRCYTLLFPSGPTLALLGILALLNIVDILFIILLDLDNPAVASLPGWPRFAASVFQAVSSRHTGTTSFNLAAVNPAVQMSLLVMMYVSVYPISIAVRSSNTYEERSLGLYEPSIQPDEQNGGSYFVTHLRNQLSFDLWYICLGLFCVCIAESKRIMNGDDPAFTTWAILFEGVSAYCNVGLSLGYPTIASSFCTEYSTFSKLVICAMMIRGRHRGLPYALDRAIVLPDEKSLGTEVATEDHDHDE